ncbi:peptidoglycan DD-metalloendopeptidase family protein [Marinimicrobium alkaliphilum]|uniref:peptidoglycan DD-metalloendopeptidase family protein n=1 Tax=Marinimicrobium alkaliphilum TaxID=2202654 RepID=UPI001E529062|nr:peptidoglycan DD-metalloendopeptidase family protein [Marinimicrobium alkaliphilum]
MKSCGTAPPAQISERDQPPSRRIQDGARPTGGGATQRTPVPDSGEHRVARGETLYSIAWRYGLDYRELARHNGIAEPFVIYPSQTLRLDVGRTAAAQARAQPPATSRPQASQPPVSSRSENRTTSSRATATPSGSPNWRWPSDGRVIGTFNSNAGLNRGIDIAGDLGQPVIAASSGQVVYAGSGLRGYGRLLIIKHNDTYLSAYAHNNRLLVEEGDVVEAGQRVAEMGSSGTDRVKLHFEIRRDGNPVNPMDYLPNR